MVVVLLIVLLLMLLASFLANDAAASFDERRSPPARSGVKFRRGQPLGRARSSGGFARRANFNDHETARSCCEPSRGLDAVERRWSWPGTPRVRGSQPQRRTPGEERFEQRGRNRKRSASVAHYG